MHRRSKSSAHYWRLQSKRSTFRKGTSCNCFGVGDPQDGTNYLQGTFELWFCQFHCSNNQPDKQLVKSFLSQGSSSLQDKTHNFAEFRLVDKFQEHMQWLLPSLLDTWNRRGTLKKMTHRNQLDNSNHQHKVKMAQLNLWRSNTDHLCTQYSLNLHLYQSNRCKCRSRMLQGNLNPLGNSYQQGKQSKWGQSHLFYNPFGNCYNYR